MAQYQIPEQVRQVSGATSTFFTPIDGAKMRYQQTRLIPGVKVQIDVGATVQQTSPIPPVTTNPSGKWYAPDQNTRWDENDLGRMAQLDGSTKMLTDPVPPVTTNPSGKYYVPDVNRFFDENDLGRNAQLDGATKMQTHPTPPVSQPEMRYYLPFTNRYIWEGPEQFFDGATVMRTDPIPPVSNPLFNYYLPSVNRHIDEIVKRFEGATTIRTDPVPPPGQPLFNHYLTFTNRYIIGPAPRLEGATVMRTDPVPPVSQPELTYYFRRDPNLIGAGLGEPKQFNGATTLRTDPIPPVSEPIFNYYLTSTNRYIDQIVKRFDGALTQQTYIFPVNEPRREDYLRILPGTEPQIEFGSTVQQTYVFPVNEPFQYTPLRSLIGAIYPPDVTPRVIDLTLLSRVESQPTAQWYATDVNRYLTGSSPRLETITVVITKKFGTRLLLMGVGN